MDPLKAHLHPSGMLDSCPVNMMRSFDSRSYIREDTLKRNNIAWQGTTVNLSWNSWSIKDYQDQAIKYYCFNVVEKEAALAAGMTFDMLIGIHDREVSVDQPRTVSARTIDHAHGPSCQSFEQFLNDSRGPRSPISVLVIVRPPLDGFRGMSDGLSDSISEAIRDAIGSLNGTVFAGARVPSVR